MLEILFLCMKCSGSASLENPIINFGSESGSTGTELLGWVSWTGPEDSGID